MVQSMNNIPQYNTYMYVHVHCMCKGIVNKGIVPSYAELITGTKIAAYMMLGQLESVSPYIHSITGHKPTLQERFNGSEERFALPYFFSF